MVRAHLRICRRIHQLRLLPKAAQFSAQILFTQVLSPASYRTCMLCRTHACTLAQRQAISGEPQKSGGGGKGSNWDRIQMKASRATTTGHKTL